MTVVLSPAQHRALVGLIRPTGNHDATIALAQHPTGEVVVSRIDRGGHVRSWQITTHGTTTPCAAHADGVAHAA